MKTIEQQKEILEKAFAGISIKPEPIEEIGTYVIPKFTGSYNNAVKKVLKALAESRPFYNWREENFGKKYLQETKAKKTAMKKLYTSEEGDYITIQAQMGLKYKGKSVKEARTLFAKNEFGLGAYEVGCILLTHPEILQKHEDLWIDCAGDGYAPGGDGQFSHAPCFRCFGDDELRFDTEGLDAAYGRYGSASGFVPQ